MTEDCIEWAGARSPKGSGLAFIKGKNYRAHRLAYCERHGVALKDIEGMVVRHTCDNPPCVNPDHLLIGTTADNFRDMMERNRRTHVLPFGETHPNAKLNAVSVLEIRKMISEGMTVTEIARKYGVRHWTISCIRDGVTWKHVQNNGAKDQS
jgi:hypothetical protein